jgi:hypothetical protein
MLSQLEAEKIKKAVAHILEKIKTDGNSQALEYYHTIFKKEVSLFQRSKAAAYLLMLCDQEKILRRYTRDKFSGQKEYGRREKPSAAKDARVDEQRYPLSEEESVRLFFSAGRSRRVFPREILGLINSKTAIPKEDIGAIRIFENYSFVQVRDSVAERIIAALNGQNFRGRPLAVNYAKSRKDEKNYAEEEMAADAAAEADAEADADDIEEENQPDNGFSQQKQYYSEKENI